MIEFRVLAGARWPLAALLGLALLLAAGRPGNRRAVAQIGDTRHAQPQQVSTIFMPLVATLPEVDIQFGTGVDDQNNLLNPGTVFAYGIARLYYRYALTGAAGRQYRTEWLVDGVRQPLLDDSGPIPAASATFTNSFCSPTLGPCDQPVPRAVYQVRLYIDNLLYREAAAVVR